MAEYRALAALQGAVDDTLSVAAIRGLSPGIRECLLPVAGPRTRAALTSTPCTESIAPVLDPVRAFAQWDGTTQLMHAVAFGMTDTVRHLMDTGVDVNVMNVSGDTAFTAAAGLDTRADAITMTQLLLSRGSADLEAVLPSVVSASSSSCCSPESLSAVVDILESQRIFQSQSQEDTGTPGHRDTCS